MIGESNPVFIVAEAGINHNGRVRIAKKLIKIAADNDCNAVKFQKKNVEKIYNKEFLDAHLESPWGTTQREMRLHREFSDSQFKEIAKCCKKNNIDWFVSCWDTESQHTMRKFKTKYNKVASAMLTHTKLLELIAEEKKYTFISTGMSTLKQIDNAIKIFKKFKCPFELMHSHSAYPMPLEEANLKVIQTLRKKFKCNVGYSGHESSSISASLPAAILGATSIERHITIDRSMYGSDQAASLAPAGLRNLVECLRLVEKIMGSGKKRVWDSEKPNIKKLRQKFI